MRRSSLGSPGASSGVSEASVEPRGRPVTWWDAETVIDRELAGPWVDNGPAALRRAQPTSAPTPAPKQGTRPIRG